MAIDIFFFRLLFPKAFLHITMSHLSDEDDEFLYGASDVVDTKTKNPLDTKNGMLRSG